MFLEDNTLREALTFAKCRELPKKYDPKLGLIWIMAIALIKKKNLMSAYAIVEQRADGLISYKKTFGKVSPLNGIISIHPYMYLDKDLLEESSKISIRTLATKYSDIADKIINANEEELNIYKLQYAIDSQKSDATLVKPRFSKSIVEEAEEAANPVKEEELAENEAIATVEDEGECVIEVEDAKDAFKPKRGRKSKLEG